MNLETLRAFALFRGYPQAELARAAGVSRQRVSQWFKQPESFANIRSDNLLRLSERLGVSADILLRPLPHWKETRIHATTELLWDRLFPTLEEFLRSVILGDERALARLVEIYGFFRGKQIAGLRVWKAFSNYKRYIPPKRRMELEVVWDTQKNLGLI